MRYSYRLLTSSLLSLARSTTTLDRVGAGFALARGGRGGGGEKGGGGRGEEEGGEVKTTGKRSPPSNPLGPTNRIRPPPAATTVPSYLKWRTRRISPSLISTRRNFCIDVSPPCQYIHKKQSRAPASPGKLQWRAPPTWRRWTKRARIRNRIHTPGKIPCSSFEHGFFGLGNMTGRRFKRRCFQRFPPFYIHPCLYKGYGGNKRGRE